jgi:hypothetical protein
MIGGSDPADMAGRSPRDSLETAAEGADFTADRRGLNMGTHNRGRSR